MSEGHAAVVLAAGGSRRLGHPKQLLTRDGEALVHRAVRLAAETLPSRLIVVVGANAVAITEAIADLEPDAVVNPHWSTGRAASIALAASILGPHAGPVLLLGCDQPALELEHLQQLLEGARSAALGCAATVHGDHLGTPALVAVEVWQQAHALAGEHGFGGLLTALGDAVWRLDAPELLFDIDTPENEQAAIARGLLDGAD